MLSGDHFRVHDARLTPYRTKDSREAADKVQKSDRYYTECNKIHDPGCLPDVRLLNEYQGSRAVRRSFGLLARVSKPRGCPERIRTFCIAQCEMKASPARLIASLKLTVQYTIIDEARTTVMELTQTANLLRKVVFEEVPLLPLYRYALASCSSRSRAALPQTMATIDARTRHAPVKSADTHKVGCGALSVSLPVFELLCIISNRVC